MDGMEGMESAVMVKMESMARTVPMELLVPPGLPVLLGLRELPVPPDLRARMA